MVAVLTIGPLKQIARRPYAKSYGWGLAKSSRVSLDCTVVKFLLTRNWPQSPINAL